MLNKVKKNLIVKFVKRLSFFLLVTMTLDCQAFAASQDKINLFLQEFIDGKPTGEFIHFEFIIYSLKDIKNAKWLLTEEVFSTIKDQKFTTVNLIQSRSNDDYSTPLISAIKWRPGKELNCTYEPFGGMDIHLKAEKKSSKQYDWAVYCVGHYKLTAGDTEHKWEFKSVTKQELDFNELRLQNLYYQ